MLTVAGIINAFGITIFLSPVKLYDSGISGTSMLLDQITPEYLSLSVFLLILNIPLFLFGLKKQGKLFTGYAIYTVAIYSLSAWLITDILPIDVSMASPLAGTDLLLCALFVVFFFDLDGKLLFNVVEPFLKKHYDNMPRKDTLKTPYDMDKYPKYEY